MYVLDIRTIIIPNGAICLRGAETANQPDSMVQVGTTKSLRRGWDHYILSTKTSGKIVQILRSSLRGQPPADVAWSSLEPDG